MRGLVNSAVTGDTDQQAPAGVQTRQPAVAANDNLKVLSDELLDSLEEPANDNDEPDDCRDLGVYIPSRALPDEVAEIGDISSSSLREGAELNFEQPRHRARGYLSE